MPGNSQPNRPNPPSDPNRATHIFDSNPTMPTAERQPILTPEEQINAVVSQYCKQHGLLMYNEKGREAKVALHLRDITRDILGPEEDPKDTHEDEAAEAWKRGNRPRSCNNNKLYDTHVIDIVGAAHDSAGRDHLFVTVKEDYRSFIIPREQEIQGENWWDVRDPLFVSQGQFCGLHVIVQPSVTAQGDVHPYTSYRPLLPAGLVNQEIQKTIDRTPDTLISNIIHGSAEQLLPSLQNARGMQATPRLDILVGTQSGPGRCEALGIAPNSEAIVVVGMQTDEIDFDLKAEVAFSSNTSELFQVGAGHGDTDLPSMSALRSHLFRNAGVERRLDLNSERVQFIKDAVHQKLLRRFDPNNQLSVLTFCVESAIVSREDKKGVLCVSFRDPAGWYYAPSESGTPSPSRDPLVLVVTPELTHKVRRTGVRRDLIIPGVPWMLEEGRVKVGPAASSAAVKVTLNGIVCSEQAFCQEMVRLTDSPTQSILYSGLLDRVRNQLRREERPIAPLNPEVLGISGKSARYDVPETGYTLIRHSSGYSFLLVNRDSNSGFIEFQRAAAADALFLEPR